MALTTPAPLESAWEGALAAALGRTVDPRALALMVERQSRRYRGEDVPLARGDELAARALFWLPRDLPKAALPIAELSAAGALPLRPLRVLDLGAGLGATSLGLARALPPGASVGSLTAVDRDADALALLRRVTAEARSRGLIPAIPELVTETRDLARAHWDAGLGTYDLVTVGLALVEVTRGLADESARGQGIAALLRVALPHVSPDGALVVLEPAGRDDARALQRARDALAAEGVTVFAPCPHARGCPMLANPTDWCHEDLADASLPPWLVPVARAAGLRWEGLTFSYLVLRRDGRTLAAHAVSSAGGAGVPLRLLSPPLVTKGKTEVVACGDLPPGTSTRLMELQRAARDARETSHGLLADTARGDVITVAAEVAARAEPGRPLRVAPGDWSVTPSAGSSGRGSPAPTGAAGGRTGSPR